MFGTFSGYDLSERLVKALNQQDYSFLQGVLGQEIIPDDQQSYTAKWSDVPCDEHFIEWLTKRGFKPSISTWHSMIPTGDMRNHSQTVNHFHLPSIGLLVIDEVTWEEDCCTERLQERLDEGWRILAVCYQMPKRRPDYILGRTRKVT